jgi:hypothetical protein
VLVDKTVRVAKAEERFSVRERDLAGHIEGQNEQKAIDAGAGGEQLSTDPQLERALDLLKTWHVFSRFQDRGTGIRPIQQADAAASE